MSKFIKDSQIGDMEISICPNCQQSPLKEIAQADSLFFITISYHLLRCMNKICNTHAWVSIRKYEGGVQCEFTLISKSGELPQRLPSPLRKYKVLQLDDNILPSLPNMLADDFDQAYRCFLSNFYDASVCLARRALERALLGKGVKSRRLGDMIEDSVNQGIVPPEVKTLCEDIKAYGNKGAHPKSNDVPVSQGEAEYALLFTDVMVAWLYGNIRPANSNISLS